MSRRGSKGGDASSSHAYASWQAKRRAAALERQQSARADKVAIVRSLALAALQDGGDAAMQAEAQHPQGAQLDDQCRQQQAADRCATGASASGRPQAPPGSGLFGLDGVEASSLSGAALKAYFARQLMQPEWLSDIPPDLASAWLAMPRPEGRRCLVISARGWTVARSRTGAPLARFHSRLPGGGAGGNRDTFCVLDCILQEQTDRAGADHAVQQQQQQQQQQVPRDVDMAAVDEAGTSAAVVGGGMPSPQPRQAGTFFIQDVLAWRAYSLVDCGAEFRLFWLASKLAEEADATGQALDGAPPGPGHEARFQLLPYWPATGEGLSAAAGAGAASSEAAAAAVLAAPPSLPQQQQPQQQQHQQQPGSRVGACPAFVQDGVYLRHVEGHYELGAGCSPLALLWKDAACSRYLVDTDPSGVVPPLQPLTLAYQGPDTGGVATADEPPVVLGRLPAAFVAQMGAKLRPGRLLRFSLQPGGILFGPDGRPAGADMAYDGPGNQRRGRADLISKVLFQARARQCPLRLADLVAAANSSGGRGAGLGELAL